MSEWIRKAFRWFAVTTRSFWPFLVCCTGGLFIQADIGVAGFFVAGIAFTWALDLAGERAAARAKEETASLFLSQLSSGQDTSLTVTFHDAS